MRELLEEFGWILVFNGLFSVFAIAVLTFAAPDGAAWEPIALLYGIAWALVYAGFKLLRRVGAWPPKT